MRQERTISVRPAASLGASFDDRAAWLSAIAASAASPVASLVAAPSEPTPRAWLPAFDALIRRRYPEHHAAFFAAPRHDSNPFTVSVVDAATLLPGGVLLADTAEGPACVVESIGDSAASPLAVATRSLRLDKTTAERSLRLTCDEGELLRQSGRALNIVLSRINNYGHWHVHNISFCAWLRDHLADLMAAAGAGIALAWCPGGPDKDGHKRHALDMLAGVADLRVLDPDHLAHGVRLRHAVVCDSYNLDRGTHWPASFRSLLASLRAPRDPSAPPLIYCNRSHAGRRGIRNEAALEEAIAALGFRVVMPGRLSYAEQRRVFSNASVIVSSHGAALTNMVYSHRAPAIIELTHPFYGPTQYGWFRDLASAMGYRYGAYISDIAPECHGMSYNDTFFDVDVPELAGLVEAAIPPDADLGA